MKKIAPELLDATKNKIKIQSIHALWILLKNTVSIRKKDFSLYRNSFLSQASNDDIFQLIELGISLGLISLSEKDFWDKNQDGIKFSQLKHWRFWIPTNKAISFLGTQNISNIFLSEQKMLNRPIVIDLFAGVGGLSLGFDSAGFDVKVAVDNDPQACEAHRKNFPGCVVVEGDINEIAKDPKKHLCKTYGINPEKVSGVIGGPPCQGFSYMGERESTDERNLLTSRFMDIVMKLEPDFFLMENVAGLLTSGARPKIGSYVRKLGKSIGVPASQIVELLPEVSTSLAKRDKQFRKRTVSEAITSYKSNLIKNHFDLLVPDASAEALTHIYGTLPFWLKDKISDAYKVTNVPNDDEKIIHSALNSSKAVLSQLAIGLFIDILMDSKSLTEVYAKDYLLEISIGKRLPKEIKTTLIKLIEEYDAAPDSTVYKGVTVGPIISHLIDRASEKYNVSAPTLLNAAWFGTPQARQRLFVIGINKRLKKSFVFPNKQFSIPNPNTPTLDNILVDAPTVFEAIGDLPDIDQFSELLDGAEFASSNLNHEGYSEYASKMRLDEIEHGNFSLPRPTWNPFVIDCSNRTIHTEDVIERLKRTDEGIQEETSHKTRLNRLKVSHTLRAGTREGKGSHTAVRPVHYEYHRVISVREGARLMGYPDWMTFHHTKWHGFRLVGNGVPFQLGNALAKALNAQLNLSPDESTNDSASE